MPIGDLLASLSGQPAASPNPAKRKAPDDDTKPQTKVARKTPPAQPSRPLDRPNAPTSNSTAATSRPYGGTSKPPGSNGVKDSLKPLNGANRVSKPAAPVRPAATTGPVSRAPPKKGSYAEILARASKAQQSMGQVGKLQHKKVEKKEKEPVTKADPRTPGAKRPVGGPGYQGTSKPGARPPTNGRTATPAKDPRGRPVNGKAQGKTAAQEEQEKKVKKAAAATTGYTGTARPRPNSTGPDKKRNAAPQRGGALLNAPPRHSRKYEDDYDEELDDFIDYDEDEDDGYGRGGGRMAEYDSDASSDMEGGFDDMELEDRRAELIARREDIEEERMEKKHKAEKEERKRRYLEGLKAKGR